MPTDHANAVAFIDYVERYLDAASYVPEGGNRLFPLMQLYGQATENALKAFLAATEGKWPRWHDLVKLWKKAEKLGLELTTDQRDIHLVELNKIYYKPDSPGWEYPTRYPSTGGSVWTTPTKENLKKLVQTIADQAGDIVGRHLQRS